MFRKTQFTRLFCLFFCLALSLSACGPALPAEEARPYFQPISSLSLPDNVTLVGMGEATHGNAEFVALHREIFKLLVEEYGFRTFAIEGDFGGSQAVNDYILHGTGTAVDAVKEIGFDIYRTREMVDLVEWMRWYNQSATPEQAIHFYGFDMQRFDNNIKGLLDFIAQVDPAKVETYRTALANLNDATLYNQSPETFQTGLQAIQSIRAEINQARDRYVQASSPAAFNLADQFAASIEQNATLRAGNVNYSELRDQYMAEKVDWIVSYEHSQGRGKIFLASHNGHIEKSGAAATYRSMGSRLNEKYGDQYFAIGTEFYEGSFNSKETGSGVRKQFSVMNKNHLNSTFERTGQDVAYLDIQLALENPALAALLTSNQPMTNIGDEFSTLYRYFPPLYTISMVPSEAYDALIFVRAATPTTMLNTD